MAFKTRTISYLRAVWFPFVKDSLTVQGVLEDCIRSLSGDDTVIKLDSRQAQLRHHATGQNLCMHIAVWKDRETAPIVPHTGSSLGEARPGEDWDYLGGDVMLLIHGNHCLTMPGGLNKKGIERFLQLLIRKSIKTGASAHQYAEMFSLESIGDPDVLDQLRSEGVKSLELNCVQYKRTVLDSIERSEPTGQRLRRAIASMLFDQEEDRENAIRAADFHAKVSVEIDRKKLGLDRIDLIPASELLMDESIDEVDIVTGKGRKIKSGKIAVQKSVKVEVDGNIFLHEDAWSRMEEYFNTLNAEGKLKL